ncbi:hypothetical protein OBBRIDRAFT_789844 [Obba rivulosa]|uniref:Uncharacterized protein n=1 Tax=Obba rivulosa TaxID=1052685 RepID=A0A8E2DQG9_9APHY|nr:hypothetical protein OBBRIDRAFT_789844 [Obba rivulosa]
MAAAQLPLDDDHPLALQLTSLRADVERYQHEAHGASVKLQRHALDTSQTLDIVHTLERENTRLREEVAILRAHPDSTPDPTSHQVQELTLALRRLSDKLTYTEEALHARASELVNARSDLDAARAVVGSAHGLAQHARAQLDESKARERELERKARAAEEERKMADLVVQEYADLVRSLEGRAKPSAPGSVNSLIDSEKSGSSATLVDSLAEGRSGLQKLLEEFNSENERLGREIDRLHGELDLKAGELSAEQRRSDLDRAKLAECQKRLAEYEANDNTAAKMVSRYMKFSQASTDALQKAMENMKARHAATAATLNAEAAQLQKTLLTERRHAEQLRDALDELAEDLSREAYGRRRETSLRLAFLSREEGLAEGLRRWIRKAREAFERALPSPDPPDASSTAPLDAFGRIIKDAEGLLDILNGQPVPEADSLSTVARLVSAQDAVATLTRELHIETEKRLVLARRLAEICTTEEHTLVSADEPPKRRKSPKRQNGDSQALESLAVQSHRPDPLAGVSVELQQAHKTDDPAMVGDSIKAHHQTSVESKSEGTLPVAESPATPKPTVSLMNGTSVHDARDIPPMKIDIPDNDPSRHDDIQALDSSIPVNLAATVPSSRMEDILDSVVQTPRTIIHPPSPSLPREDSGPPTASVADSPSMIPPDPIHPPSASSLRYSNSTVHIPTDTSSIADTVAIRSAPVKPGLPSLTSDQPAAALSSTPATVTETDTSSPDTVPTLPSTLDNSSAEQLHEHSSILPTRMFPLLDELEKVKHRYDDMQRAFRDCHLALKELKKDMSNLSYDTELSVVVQRAVERLNDLNEDTRVELEIRIADEERLAAGYMTLLSVPGALDADDEDEEDNAALAASMRAFVDGTDTTVSRAVQQLSRKLDDLQHDIAILKRTMYDLITSAEDAPAIPGRPPPAWSSWTAGLLTPARAASPVAPSFGSVVTSSRLRHSSSLSYMKRTSSETSADGQDPFAGLGLRTPMPALVLSPPKSAPKPRAASAMYMLGFGGRGHSFGLGSASPAKSLSPPSQVAHSTSEQEVTDTETETEDEEDDLDTDVE